MRRAPSDQARFRRAGAHTETKGAQGLRPQAAPLWLYEATKMVFGRGFDSPHLHHLRIDVLKRVGLPVGSDGGKDQSGLGLSVQLMGVTRFRRAQESKWTAGEATDLIGATTAIANDDSFGPVLKAA